MQDPETRWERKHDDRRRDSERLPERYLVWEAWE